jgi:hypothetical protein
MKPNRARSVARISRRSSEPQVMGSKPIGSAFLKVLITFQIELV